MIKNIFLLSIIFLLVDAGFLFLMKDNFNRIVRSIQGSDLKLNIFYTLLCYIFLISSIYYFLIIKNASYVDAFFLGLFIYGVFETTNMAIFKNWDPKVGFIDILWGGILFSSTFFIYNQLSKILKLKI